MSQQDIYRLAGLLYEAWYQSYGTKSNGQKAESWGAFSSKAINRKQVEAWEAAARAALEHQPQAELREKGGLL